ncbi:MAG TPA: hypothetical protein VNC61_16905 [Acidimicrobiales bacterium]|nr:hypothetical protein [Acidimicrobiales bacterium]
MPSSSWNNDTLHALTQITGSDFEVVDESCLMVSSGSGATYPSHCPGAS